MQRLKTAVKAAFLAGVLSLGAIAPDAQAQQAVGAHTDWSVFVAGDGAAKVCWIVSKPTRSRAVRNGQQVQVRRGDIFLMVAQRPGDGVQDEVSFFSGYPFRPNSSVEVSIGGSRFALSTDGENAWTSGPSEDAKLVGAMRRGADARVEGVSSRGTTTNDTFSLRGFTAAIEDSKKRCG